MIQGMGEEVILSFGHAAPPIALAVMDNDQMEEYLKDHPVEVQQIARFALPVHVASTLMQNLQGTLAVRRVIATTAEQEGEATS